MTRLPSGNLTCTERAKLKGNVQSIRGRSAHRLFLWLHLTHRQDREVFVPAGFAAQRRHAEQPPDHAQSAMHVLRRDALQFEVAANRAVCVKRVAQRHQPRMKSRVAGPAAPRVVTKSAQRVVCNRLTPRSSSTVLFADGASHLEFGLSSAFALRIGRCLPPGKLNNALFSKVQ
jgi:hypothetical protein